MLRAMIVLCYFLILLALPITTVGSVADSCTRSECLVAKEADDASYIQTKVMVSEESETSNLDSVGVASSALTQHSGRIKKITAIVCVTIILVFLFLLVVSLSMNYQVTTMVCFTVILALTWAGLTQFMRGTESDSQWSLSLLVTWTNNAMWPVLGIPYACRSRSAEDSRAFTSTKFGFAQSCRFYITALATNLCFNASLHFQPASHTTAIFSISVIFTVVLTLAFLHDDPICKLLWVRSRHQHAAWIGYMLCIALTVSGVIFITKSSVRPGPLGLGDFTTLQSMYLDSGLFNMLGPCLSIAAAACIAIYKIDFRSTFGGDMNPSDVGLFLAHLGIVNFIFAGPLLFGGVALGWLNLNLPQVHWEEVAAIAAISTFYNYILNFGISKTSPITVSLAMQLGIPVNLLLDVLIMKEPFHTLQVTGVLLLLCSFSITIVLDQVVKR